MLQKTNLPKHGKKFKKIPPSSLNKEIPWFSRLIKIIYLLGAATTSLSDGVIFHYSSWFPRQFHLQREGTGHGEQFEQKANAIK